MIVASPWLWPTRSGFPPLSFVVGALILSGALVLTAPIAEMDFARLFASLGKMAAFARQMFVAPDWSYAPQMLANMLQTIEITVLATAIAVAFSLPLAFLAARNATPNPVVRRLCRDLLSLMRALPELVWALAFVSAVGLGPLPGVMAMAFVTIGFMAKFFAEALEVVNAKSVEGVEAHGASGLQVLAFAMFPQAMPDLVGSVLYVLDHNLRAAVMLGLVGAGGIGYDLVMSMRLFQYDRLLLISIAIYAVVTALDRISDRLRTRIIRGRAS